jgi:uracil-DNA glycosylase
MTTTIEELDAEIRACTRCANFLKKHPVNPPGKPEPVLPRPVLSKPFSASIMLVGLAPGLSEYRSGLPFQGQAGGGIRSIFADCGVQENEFDRVVYQTSVVKCFPGRQENKQENKKGSWSDRQPDAAMKRACAGFLRSQIDVLAAVKIRA